MTTAWITRIAYTPQGTFGILEVNNFKCYTLERPYIDNTPNISCIPCGEYEIRLGTFEAGGGYDNYELVYVQGRTFIEIHYGKHMYHSKGCILLGQRLGTVQFKYGESESMIILGLKNGEKAVSEFVKTMGGQEKAKLIIENADQSLIWGEEISYA